MSTSPPTAVRKLFLPLLALFLGALALGVRFLLHAPDAAEDRGRPTAPTADRPVDATAPRATVESAIERPTGPGTAPTERSAARPDGDERFGRWTYAAGAERRVTVADAGIAPHDPGLAVLVLAAERSTADLLGRDGLLARTRRGEPVDGLVERVAVGADGTCVVALPDELDAVHLTVLGDWLLRLDTVAMARDDAPFELDTVVGGVLEVALEPPADARDVLDDPATFTARLTTDSRAFRMGGGASMDAFHGSATPDTAGVLRFPALPGGRPYELVVEHPELAVAYARKLEVVPATVVRTTLALERGATLAGRVATPDGEPVSDAEVLLAGQGLWGYAGTTLATATTAGDGAFELTNAPSGAVVVRARKDGMLEAGERTLELEPGDEVRDLEFTLDPGASVAGDVVLEDGHPAVSALVRVEFDPAALVGVGAWNAARGARGEARSDARGRFRVTGLGKGPFLVVAEWEEPLEDGTKRPRRAERAGVRPGTDDLELVLLPLPQLAGRVVDTSGAPVTDFDLHARQVLASSFVPGESRTERVEDAADGRFATSALHAGTWRVRAHAEGFGPGDEVEVVLPRPADAALLEFVLPRGAAVTGRVLAPDGSPVEGADVAPPLTGLDLVARRSGDLVVPDAQSLRGGGYRVEGLGVGTTSLVARHPDFADSVPVTIELVEGAIVADVDLVLRVGATLTGEVYDADGEPLAGGSVYLQDMSTWDGRSLDLDHAGRFEEHALTPGPVQVTVMYGAIDPGAADGESPFQAALENVRFAGAELVDGETTHVVLGVPPAEPVTVAVEVVAAGGPPPEGSVVAFVPSETTGWSMLELRPLDAEGRCELTLDEPGEYVVQFQANAGELGGFTQNTVEFLRDVPSGDRHEVRLVLPTGRIEGSVTGPDGAAVGGVRVSLEPSGGLRLGTFSGGQSAETTTAADGRFAFEFLRAGEYRVAAGGTLFGVETTTLLARQVHEGVRVEEGRATDGLRFRLEAPATLSGVVRDATGAPVDRASIFVQDAEGAWVDTLSTVSTSGGGRYSVRGLAPGRVTVFARAAGLASAGRTTRVEAGDDNRFDLVVDAGGELLVRALDAAGEPVEALVRVEGPDGTNYEGLVSVDEFLSAARTWSTDEHRIGPLPPDTYTVHATLADGRSATRTVRVGDSPVRRLKLRLR